MNKIIESNFTAPKPDFSRMNSLHKRGTGAHKPMKGDVDISASRGAKSVKLGRVYVRISSSVMRRLNMKAGSRVRLFNDDDGRIYLHTCANGIKIAAGKLGIGYFSTTFSTPFSRSFNLGSYGQDWCELV